MILDFAVSVVWNSRPRLFTGPPSHDGGYKSGPPPHVGGYSDGDYEGGFGNPPHITPAATGGCSIFKLTFGCTVRTLGVRCLPDTAGDETMLSELFRQRELVLSLVKRDLKTRYKSSVLGFLWSFCKPLLLMLVLYIVFGLIAKFEFETLKRTPFSLFLLSGILPWSYLLGSLNEGMFSIISNSSLVKKTYVPHEVFPVVSVLSNLFHLLLAMIVYVILLYSFGGHLTWHVVFVPLLVAIQTFFILGLVMLLAALNVFYRDVASIMEVILTAWFYLSPILYPVSLPGDKVKEHGLPVALDYLYMLNPMAPLLAAWHKALLLPAYGEKEISNRELFSWMIVAVVISTVLFLLGRAVFRHYSGRFADEV